MAKLARIWNRIYTICITPLKEKRYNSQGIRLKYLFFPKKSNVLVVGFQACHKNGARYNYINTLKDFPVNKLFIKDDFASNHRGNYYLGCSGKYNVEAAVLELIDDYMKKCNAEKCIFIGSSKGGYAAINFGIHYKNSIMIVAAPQYYLGNYLNNDFQMENLRDILGEVTDSGIEHLNYRLQNKIKDDEVGDTQRLYIHYSLNDHTYDEHIKQMIEDMQSVHITVNHDIQYYSVHGELKYYYPDYLKQKIKEVME